jgi:hypothetical protein
MPPTNREILAIADKRIVKVLVTDEAALTISF